MILVSATVSMGLILVLNWVGLGWTGLGLGVLGISFWGQGLTIFQDVFCCKHDIQEEAGEGEKGAGKD